MTIQEVKRQLRAAGVPAHNMAIAVHRFRCLQAFWEADRAAMGRNRCRTRQGISRKITEADPSRPVSEHQLEEWDRHFRRRGVVGLAGVSGGDRVREKREPELFAMSLDRLAAYAARVSSILAARMRREDLGGLPQIIQGSRRAERPARRIEVHQAS